MSLSLPDLPSLAALDPDNSLREGRTADVLDWLASVGGSVPTLPGGDGFSALMWMLADEERRNAIGRGLTEEQRAQLRSAVGAG